MKTSISFLFVLIANLVNGQVEVKEVSIDNKKAARVVVGKVENPVSFVAELSYKVDSKKLTDTIYELKYRNFLYSAVHDTESITFKANFEGIQLLYDNIKSIFLEENRRNKNYFVSLDLGEASITIKPFKSGGKVVARLDYQKSYGLLTETQVEKLFGK